MQPMVNEYSPVWFETFERTVPDAQTLAEVAFLERWLPLPRFETVLDLCCGAGRHAIALAERGRRVTGVDSSRHALARAARRAPRGVEWIDRDLRSLAALGRTFDAVVCLWQSFGHFDAATNAAVLRAMRDALAPHGRLVLDVYHRDFFERRQGSRRLERDGAHIEETKSMIADRLTVRLAYPDGRGDAFEWQVFTPDELRALAEANGLRALVACATFDESARPSADVPRMQWVFERAKSLSQ
jgi:SAM-dependent methyltransferase